MRKTKNKFTVTEEVESITCDKCGVDIEFRINEIIKHSDETDLCPKFIGGQFDPFTGISNTIDPSVNDRSILFKTTLRRSWVSHGDVIGTQYDIDLCPSCKCDLYELMLNNGYKVRATRVYKEF